MLGISLIWGIIPCVRHIYIGCDNLFFPSSSEAAGNWCDGEPAYRLTGSPAHRLAGEPVNRITGELAVGRSGRELAIGSRVTTDDDGRDGPMRPSRRLNLTAPDNHCGRFFNFTCYSLVPWTPATIPWEPGGGRSADARTRPRRPRVAAEANIRFVRPPEESN